MRRTGTVELDRREAQLLGNLSVLDLASLLKRETLDALSHIRAGGNGAATAECLELDIRAYCCSKRDVVVDLSIDTENLLSILAEQGLGTSM